MTIFAHASPGDRLRPVPRVTSEQRAAARGALGERLLLLRRRLGLSQAELAEHCGVSQSAVSAWELGKSEPQFLDIDPLCEALGVSYAVLQGASPLPSRP